MSDRRIYVASLLDYTSGELHGQWFDLDEYVTADKLMEDIHTLILDTSPIARASGEIAEEFAIHDFEGFGPIEIGEYMSISDVMELHLAVSEIGDEDAFMAFYPEQEWSCIDEAVDTFRNSFIGELSIEEYADDYAQDALGLEDVALHYFDTKKFARDLILGGDIVKIDEYLFYGW